jgi:sulfite reductase alpha subunit-like flavoprotein
MVFILYGTQTNTAKHASEELARQLVRRGYKPRVMELDEFPIMQLPQTSLVIFVVATTGDGEAPSTMRKAWKFLLRSDLPPGSLK